MLSQNNQGNVQQCLFTGAMAAKPVMNVNSTMSRQNTAHRVSAVKPTMTVKQNFGGAKQTFAVASQNKFAEASQSWTRASEVVLSASAPGTNMHTTPDTYSSGGYLNSLQMNANTNANQNLDSFKQASMNTQAQTSSVVGTISEAQIMQAKSSSVEYKNNTVVPAEEVSFEISNAEEMPVVMENHFESSATRKEGESLIQNSVNSTYGVVQNFMYNFFRKQQLAKSIPVFMASFAMLQMGMPMPAFAATKAAVGAAAVPVASSGMTKLLKSVFCAGAAAVFTVTFIHPIDVVKTRMQVAGKGEGGLGQVIGDAMKNEGPGAFYKGIGPAWLREASYTSLRLGLYEPVKALVGANAAGAGFLRKFLAGALAGAIGSCAGNPFDVLKTKMMANKDSNEGLGFYASEVMKAEGIMGFYKGFNTNVIRAMVLNATKMACYDTIKGFLVASFALEGLLLQFCAAFSAGFFLTCTVSPFDKCRTLLMNQKEGDEKQFTGLPDCFMHIVKTEGFGGLYKGFIPIWSRFAPTTCLQLITFEQLKRLPFIALA